MSDWARIGLSVGGFIIGSFVGYPGLGLLAGTYAGSLLFPTKYESEMPPLHDYPVQTSAVGIPIAIVLGTARLAGNIIHMGELVSYQIKHTAGGKGGTPEQVSYETKYKRSFLIAICEGPAYIRQCWKGKDLISLSDFTQYPGVNNSGIGTLIDEDYAEYKNLCLAYFEDYELGNSQAIPNFLFEVSTSKVRWKTTYVTTEGYLSVLDQNYNLVENIQLPEGGAMTLDIDGVGNVVVGQYDTTKTRLILHYDKDGNRTDDFYDGTWHVESDVVRGLRFTHDSRYLYALIHIGLTGWSLHKFDNITGTELWYVDYNAEGASGTCMALEVDSNDNVYISYALGGMQGVKSYSSDGVLLANYDSGLTLFSTFDIFIDESGGSLDAYGVPIGRLYAAGSGVGGAPLHYYQFFAVDLDNTNLDVGQLVDEADTAYAVFVKNGSVYATGNRMNVSGFGNSSVWKLDLDLTVLAVYDTGYNSAHLWTNWREEIVVYRGTGSLATQIYLLDDDLNLISSHDYHPVTSQLYGGEGVSLPAVVLLGDATDENFAWMIKDLLTNERLGNYDESDLIIADFDSVILYCENNGLKGSLAITSQRPLPDWIEYICSHFQGYIYDIGGKIGLNCYRSQASVLPITRDDLKRDGKEPPVHIKKRPYPSTINRLEAAWTDRANDYRISVVPAFDRIDQREAGQVRTKILDLKAITNSDLASRMAWRIFIDQIYRFGQYTFRLGYKSMLLEVGDVIDVTDGFLLTAKKMRAMSIEESKDGRSALVTAVEDIADFYPAISYAVQESEAALDAAIVLEDGTVAFREQWDEGKLHLSIAPGGAQCNGWYIYKSYDDASYSLVGRAAIETVTGGGANCTGTFQSNLPAYPAVVHRREEAFDVSIGTITDLNTAVTDDDFFNKRKLAKIGNEIIAYKDCVESAVAGTWRVSNLIRGLFWTEAVAHVPGETFSTLDVDFTLNLQESDIGKTLYFKVASFYANKIQLLSDVSSQDYQVQGVWRRPGPVSLMRIRGREGLSTYKTADVIIDWFFCSHTSGFGIGGYGSALWGAFIMDETILTVKVILKKIDDTEISSKIYEIGDLGSPPALLIEDADRDGNNTFKVELLPGSTIAGVGSREIQIEQL